MEIRLGSEPSVDLTLPSMQPEEKRFPQLRLRAAKGALPGFGAHRLAGLAVVRVATGAADLWLVLRRNGLSAALLRSGPRDHLCHV